MNHTELPEQPEIDSRRASPLQTPDAFIPPLKAKKTESDAIYHRRIVFSVLVSTVLNILLLWLLLVSDFSRIAWLQPVKAKPIAKREPPRIILQRHPPPKSSPTSNPTFLETDKSQAS